MILTARAYTADERLFCTELFAQCRYKLGTVSDKLLYKKRVALDIPAGDRASTGVKAAAVGLEDRLCEKKPRIIVVYIILASQKLTALKAVLIGVKLGDAGKLLTCVYLLIFAAGGGGEAGDLMIPAVKRVFGGKSAADIKIILSAKAAAGANKLTADAEASCLRLDCHSVNIDELF